MTLQIQIIIAAVIASVAFISGWKVNGWRYDSTRTAEIEASNKALDAVAKELAKIEVKNVTIKQQLETKIIERPVYRDCIHAPDVMLLINEALSGKSTGSGKLSRTDPTTGQDIRRNHAEAN